MKKFEIPEPKDYQHFVTHYREVMREGKEDQAFLGTEAWYRFRQRDSYELDSTDISVLMEYCLYPLYVEGDRDIARRTFNILKYFSLSVDLVKLDKVTDYISIQNWFLTEYSNLPFVIETDELERNIIDSISKLSDEQKRTYTYERLCNVLDRSPLYRQCDEEKVEKILKEFKEKYYNPPKVVETIKTVEKIVLDVTSIDAMGVSDDHLELLLIDENKWIESLEEEHLLKLQEKLNNYIYFLESKQYVARYGDSFDKKVIHITFQYSPSDNGLAFLAAVQKTLQNTDMSLKVELPDDETLPEKKSSLADVSQPKQEQEKVSQERYLQIKKEYKVRLVLVVFLLFLSFILYLFIILSFSRHIPFIATVMGTVIPFNHFLLVPVWQEKKAIEEEHPEWKNLSTSEVKVPSSESSKRTLAAIGTILALFLSFAMLYRPVKVNTKIPTAEEIKNMPRFDNNYTPKSKSSSSSEPESRSTTSDLNETSSTEESTQSQNSSKESQNYPHHIPGMSDEELKRVIDKTLKDFNEKREKEENSEKTESGNE
ncbi:conserved hypothetical protein [Streptococcus oralis Uo5]|uniref:Uncharacterized protein n=1 Tax=Streptococcus oralis (strain Uo5) TaxID=927666 RepID=F2QE39_STROU|nr:conserved hypothetical protein [Streptococcus oralis Uo5]